MLLLALLLAYTGVDPISLTTVTMAAAAAALPFTFIPLLIVANDQDFMGEQKNTFGVNLVALIVLALLVVVTVATIPLYIVTGGGT
jgi:Mn2+/Fe2+ NRAMP family transporter